MTAHKISGFNGDHAGSLSSVVQLASIVGPAWVCAVDIQGIIAYENLTATITAGVYPASDLAAGVQYGVVGYGGTANTTGSASGATWISYNEQLSWVSAGVWTAGSAPQNIAYEAWVALGLHWRGAFPVPASGYDIYCVIGTDTAKSYALDFFSTYTYSIDYATFP